MPNGSGRSRFSTQLEGKKRKGKERGEEEMGKVGRERKGREAMREERRRGERGRGEERGEKGNSEAEDPGSSLVSINTAEVGNPLNTWHG